VIHDGVKYDPFQGQGHGGLKVAKIDHFKVRQYVIERLTVHW